MELTPDEQQLLSLYHQCSPMQRMLITDALQEMLAMPGEIDLFSEAMRDDYLSSNASMHQEAVGAESMGKVLPFRRG